MLVRLLRSRWAEFTRPLILLVILQAAQTIATLYLPTVSATLIDTGVLADDPARILGLGAVMVVITAFQVAAVVTATVIGSRTAAALARDIRRDVFGHVRRFSGAEMARFTTASLITRSTNDIQQLQSTVLLVCTTMVAAPLTAVGAIVLALTLDIPLAVTLVAVAVVLAAQAVFLIRRTTPLSRAAQGRLDDVNRVLGEQITGVRVIRAFVRDADEQRRFGAVNVDLADVSQRAGRLTTLMFPLLNTTVNVAGVAIAWLVGRDVGTLTAFLGYLALILTSVMMANNVLSALPRAEACAARVHEVLTTPPTVRPPAVAVRAAGDGAIRVRHAAHGVLRDVSFTAWPGETTAVVGPVGSGKTTLLHLIARLLDVTAGQVLIDGVDVRDIGNLTDIVTLVPQRPHLFAGTIADNLRYARPDATDADLRRALATAQLDIDPDTPSTQLSGGQRQRVTIARAVLRRPRIYLLDDCTSALDEDTERRVWAALRAEPATLVAVTHTLGDADQTVDLSA
jgi:ATP-binding cassette subfamily B protein